MDQVLEKLSELDTVIQPEDSITEAGRKRLLVDFKIMLQNEAGSRDGGDIEYVHDMRVATRRMRSIFRLLEGYYKPKATKRYRRSLKRLARYLGKVRDLDVMLVNLEAYQTGCDADTQVAIQKVIKKVDKQRSQARGDLIDYLDSKKYRRFVKQFAKFLAKPDKGVSVPPGKPYQVRHLAPVLIHQKLAHVRAFDAVDTYDVAYFHKLRIEFKRLRYTVAFMTDVLGRSAEGYIEKLKVMQDHLGDMNDMVVAYHYFKTLQPELKRSQAAAVGGYLSFLETKVGEQLVAFPDAWQHFNTRTVQRMLVDALLVLR